MERPIYLDGDAGVIIGRDRFFEVLKEKSLLPGRLPGMPRTTDSRHSLPVFHNPVKDMVLAEPDQAWAGDITYIRTGEGFLYPSLLTDLRSRKTVGFHAGDTLEAEGAVRALETALSGLPEGAFPVHHSDRGCQYCPRRYVEKLRDHGLAVSMTEDTRCYENARAERDVEAGIQSWLFVSEQEAGVGGGGEAVSLYNTRRPHLSLNCETPETMHRRAA
jgi:transposase InsO family protein